SESASWVGLAAEFDRGPASTAQGALDPDAAPIGFGQPFCQRQAEAYPLALRGEQRLEYVLEVVGRDAASGVRHGDLEAVRERSGPHAQGAALRHGLDGIGEEVVQDETNLVGIDHDRSEVLCLLQLPA